MAKIQITGGGFQDSEGNPLASGYLIMELSQDCRVAATAQVCSGIVLNVPLDGSGNVSGTVLVWPNDQLAPSNNYYTVTGYTANGQKAWGPNVQQITGAGPFNLNGWVPNQLTNWIPVPYNVQLQTNEVNNGNQTLLDLHAGQNISLTDNGAGRVTIANTTLLQTNEVNNGSQSVLDLHAGTNVSLADNGTGRVTISSFDPTRAAKFLNYAKMVFQGVTLFPQQLNANLSTAFFNFQRHQWNNPTSTEQAYFQQGGLGGSGLAGGTTFDQWKFIGLQTLSDFSARVIFPTNGVKHLHWIGITDAVESGATGSSTLVNGTFNTANPAANFCGFRFDFNDGDAHWQAYCGTDATHFTTADTGVNFNGNTSAMFEFQYAAGSVNFFINYVQVASISTNLPTSVPLGLIVLSVNGTSAGNNDNGEASNGLMWSYWEFK